MLINIDCYGYVYQSVELSCLQVFVNTYKNSGLWQGMHYTIKEDGVYELVCPYLIGNSATYRVLRVDFSACFGCFIQGYKQGKLAERKENSND